MNMWYSKARENLLTKSVESQNFKQALSEFKYIGVEDNQTTDKNCELCDHPNIRYEYLVENQINQNTLIVGSRCIEKFIDNLAEDSLYLHDDSGNYVDKKRVSLRKKHHKEQWNNLENNKRDFIKEFLTTSQKQSLNIK